MVLINGLTIDEINAALIALQRSKTEVVGGEKHTTVQNISVNNTGGGSGTDFTPQILQLQRKDQELQGGIDALDTRVTDLENTLSSLTDNEIDYLEWDERTRTLYVYTTDGEEYSVDLPSETVTLSVVNNNVLRFTMGVGETNAPQIVDVTLPFIRSAEKGVAGGVATLDASGRVPYSQLPESAMEFKGEWDASTNTPHLEDGTGTNGDFYIVSVGGTVNFGTQAEPRLITFYPNDRVLFDGSADEWKRLPAGQVISVNGQSGVVVLDATNINYNSNTTVKQAIDSKADASDVVQSDWTEADSSDPAFIKNKIPIWITTGQADDNMSPIDSVTDGSMRPITSNAVYDAFSQYNYPTIKETDANNCTTVINTVRAYELPTTASNIPNSNYAWNIIVTRNDHNNAHRITQLAQGQSGQNTELYIRGGASANGINWTWGNWVKVTTTADIVDSVTANNMQSVTSNAVANRLGYFNVDAGYFITDAMKTIIRNSFNNASQYSPFTGYTSTGYEGYWIGFRNATTGVGYFMTRNLLIGFYLDADSFRQKYILTF